MQIIALVALVKLLDSTNKPFLCSGLYAALVFCVGFFWGGYINEILIETVLAFAISSVYFWVLNRVEGLFFWVILVLGLPMALL